MIRKEREGCVWFEFEILQAYPEVRHGCFTRIGGVSTSEYSSLNVGFNTGEDRDTVCENRRRVQAEIFRDAKGVTFDLEQVHGDAVVLVEKNIVFSKPQADAMITDMVGVNLLIKHADCQPCILFDPEHRVIGNVHSGWRGNVKNIYASAVQRMCERWGSKPEKILACIGPSLGPDWSEFKNWEREFPSSFLSHRVRGVHFDLWSVGEEQLLAEGLLKSNIEIAKMCTYSLPELFFSYRRDKVTGRNATCVALVPQ
jgi:YfiH family protein